MSLIEVPQKNPFEQMLAVLKRAAHRNDMSAVADVTGHLMRDLVGFIDSGFQRIWNLLIGTHHGVNQLNIFFHLNRLTIQMICNIMVEKGILTKEEFDARYKTDVDEALKKLQEDINKQLEEQAKKQKEAAEGSADQTEEETLSEEISQEEPASFINSEESVESPAESNVILASERFSGEKREDNV